VDSVRLTSASLPHAISGHTLFFCLLYQLQIAVKVPTPEGYGRRRRYRASFHDPKEISVISAYATRRGAYDALAPSGADNVDGRPHLDGEGPQR
jgi:hypothetical protein